MSSEIQSQRLHRVYENAKNSLNIETQVCFAGLRAQTTMYHMDISFRSTRNKWSIAKRYSEFFKVRRTLGSVLKQYKHHFGSDLPLPLQTLVQALETPFPRRHLRADTATIIDERKPLLEAFVQMLVKVISSIPMTDAATVHTVTSSMSHVTESSSDASQAAAAVTAATPVPAPVVPLSREAMSMAILYQVLRDFLEYPDKQIESETKLKLAVLSLEDVVVSSKSNVLETDECLSDCCSICLGEWNDEECADMNVVKLPCLHAFHEECLMEWLQGNTHCPMCRDEPAPPLAPRESQ